MPLSNFVPGQGLGLEEVGTGRRLYIEKVKYLTQNGVVAEGAEFVALYHGQIVRLWFFADRREASSRAGQTTIVYIDRLSATDPNVVEFASHLGVSAEKLVKLITENAVSS